MNARTGLLGLMLAASSLVACGGGETTSSTATTTKGANAPATTVAPPGSTPTSATQGAAVIPLPNAWDILVTGPGGYRFDVKLEVADKTVKIGTRHGTIAAGAACQLDSRKDALIPARVTLTNSTPGFAAAPRATFYFLAFGDAVELATSSSSACRTYDNAGLSSIRFSVSSPGEIATGKQHQVDAFIVVKNYYTPASPNGDLSALRSIELGVSDSAASTTQAYDAKLVAGPSMPKKVLAGWPLPIGSLVAG